MVYFKFVLCFAEKRKSKSDAPAMKQVKMSGFFKEQKKRHVTLVKLKAQATTVSGTYIFI